MFSCYIMFAIKYFQSKTIGEINVCFPYVFLIKMLNINDTIRNIISEVVEVVHRFSNKMQCMAASTFGDFTI